MVDTFAQAIFDDRLKNADMAQIISDRVQTITVKRRATTGNGFSNEMSDYTSVGTIRARLDNPSAKTQYKYLMSSGKDVESIQQLYIGITRDTSLGVIIGDIWVFDSAEFVVIAFTGGSLQNRIEVFLTTLDEAVKIIA